VSTRRIILVLHLWAGAMAALFLFLLGVTGSLMTFEDEIDRALNEKLTWIRPSSQRLSLAEMKSRLEKSHPGFTVSGFAVSPRDDIAWGAFLSSNTSQQGIGVSFNQFTGEILGNAAERIDFMNSVHQLHLRLLAGKTGGTVVSVAAVFLLFLSISGLVLWWPRKIVSVKWRSPLTKLNFDLHQALGIYTSFFLMIFSLTAIVIHWENEATALANRLSHSDDLPPFPQPQPPLPGAVPLNADQVLLIAERTAPGARATYIQLDGNPIRIPMKYPEDRTPAGRTNIFIDAYTGKVVYHSNSRTGPLGFRMVKLRNREIHTGDICGLPTRILACFLSLTLPVMAVTGPLIWWNRRPRFSGGGAKATS
jgi:uncharacterized iron-regulated membrane protein